MQVYKFFILASQLSAVLPFIFFVVYRENLTKPFRVLVLYFSLSLMTELITTLIKQVMPGGNNMIISHLFTPIEFGVIVSVFCNNLIPNTLQAFDFFLLMMLLFIVVAIYGCFQPDYYLEYNTLTRGFESIVLCVLALIYFYISLKEEVQEPLWNSPMFWFSTSVLLYFGVTFFGAIMKNMLDKREYGIHFVNLHSIINTLSNLLYVMVVRCFVKRHV